MSNSKDKKIPTERYSTHMTDTNKKAKKQSTTSNIQVTICFAFNILRVIVMTAVFGLSFFFSTAITQQQNQNDGTHTLIIKQHANH